MKYIAKKNYFLLLAALIIPVIIYLYFLPWMTTAIYGDDLSIYLTHNNLQKLGDKINMDVLSAEKFRPVHSIGMHLLIKFFQKNIEYYYLFNIVVQSINTLLFALLLNLFLQSRYLSLALSLTLGLSRYSLFNITQLLNGGILEGLAMTFLLLSLYFTLKILINNSYSNEKKKKGIFIGLLFANLSMYSHERYIAIFPFFILLILLYPTLKTLTFKTRMALILTSIGSMILNFAIKKYIFSIPFFVGTGGTIITFSFSAAFSFFIEGILSILQINTGPGFLSGISFSDLPRYNKIPIILVPGIIAFIGILYFMKVKKLNSEKNLWRNPHFTLLLFLPVLLVLLLLPAVVTIRLEQRWLQASSSIFILMVAIVWKNLEMKSSNIKKYLLVALIILFVWSDYTYLSLGANKLSMIYSNRFASGVKELVTKGIIKPNTQKLYLWENQRNTNSEEGINWILANGYFFWFYQEKDKKIVYIDSIYDKPNSLPSGSLHNFNKKAEQLFYIGDNMDNITNEYLQDSIKSITPNEIYLIDPSDTLLNDPKRLIVNNDNFSNFSANGFYDNENGIRWTNGNADIIFKKPFVINDSAFIKLNTYMGSIHQKINIRIAIINELNKAYPAVPLKREGDNFIFKVNLNQPTAIQKINIISDTIIPNNQDIRKLSFPFISLEINQK